MLKRTITRITGLGTAGFMTSVLLAAPAVAEGIPRETLNEHRAACIKECTQRSSAESCKQLCGCTTDKIAENWTAADYDDVYNRLQANAADKDARRKLEKLHRMCTSDG